MGCVLYVATLGSRPFGNGADALRKILLNEYKAPRALRPDYPEQLEAIIKRALAPSPEARFATAEDMQMALEEWLLSTGKLVTGSDVARCVRERISPEVKARNEALLSQNRVAPELLMNQLRGEDDSETPTAGSGLVTAPPGLWIGPNGGREAEDDGVTLRGGDPLPSGAFRAPPRAEARPAIAPRLSDATELVDFVPEGTAAKPSDSTEIEPRRALEPAWKAALGLLLLLVVAALLIWLALGR
jgi:hypothetical protein